MTGLRMPPAAVARMVHYVDDDGAHVAAVITYVYQEGEDTVDDEIFGVLGSEWVSLHVMYRHGCQAVRLVCQDDRDKAPRTWHWPERT